jgi:hypothetical protein
MSLDIDLYLEVDVGTPEPHRVIFYCANITHNLTDMADVAGIYKMVWRPEKNGIETASQLIAPLTIAIEDMKKNPKKYKKFDAENGWGTYDDFVPWLCRLRDACKKFPIAKIKVSR